jgi:hypothetical protein
MNLRWLAGAGSNALNWVIIEVDRQPVGQGLRGAAKRRLLRGMVTRALFSLGFHGVSPWWSE